MKVTSKPWASAEISSFSLFQLKPLEFLVVNEFLIATKKKNVLKLAEKQEIRVAKI